MTIYGLWCYQYRSLNFTLRELIAICLRIPANVHLKGKRLCEPGSEMVIAATVVTVVTVAI